MEFFTSFPTEGYVIILGLLLGAPVSLAVTLYLNTDDKGQRTGSIDAASQMLGWLWVFFGPVLACIFVLGFRAVLAMGEFWSSLALHLSGCT